MGFQKQFLPEQLSEDPIKSFVDEKIKKYVNYKAYFQYNIQNATTIRVTMSV